MSDGVEDKGSNKLYCIMNISKYQHYKDSGQRTVPRFDGKAVR
jgi:hypothetical protein